MSAHGFTSAFAQELDAYLAFKEKMGFYGSSRIWYLKRFDAYCSARARTVFDTRHRGGMGDRAAGRLGPLLLVDVLYP
jgi:hypothetical protein